MDPNLILINERMKKLQDPVRAQVSDGYHTFEELYDHRIRLYLCLCKNLTLHRNSKMVWCSTHHSDGSHWEGWFILGINYLPGQQITYHLPLKYWDEVAAFAKRLDKSPDWDGHTPEEVLERLKKL